VLRYLIITVSYFFLAAVLGVVVPVYWFALFFYGIGSICRRTIQSGIIGFNVELLWPFMVVLAPAAISVFKIIV